MVIIIYILGLFGCVVGLTLKLSNKFYNFIILGVIIYLMGRGAATPDTLNYVVNYFNAPNVTFADTYEPGYLLLQKIGHFLGFNYIQFRFLIVGLALLLVNKTVRFFTKNIYFVYLFYFLFLIFIDTDQLRNFLAFSFIIFGIKYLITDNKFGFLKYFGTVVIASTIHIGTLIYCILLLLKFKNRKVLIKIIAATAILLSIAVYLSGNRIGALMSFFDSLNSERLMQYNQTTTKLGFLYAFVLHLFSIFLLWRVKKFVNRSTLYIRKYSNFIDALLWINIVSIIFFPLYMTNLQFIRLCRNYLLLNLIAFSFLFYYKEILLRKKFIYILIILNIIFWFVYTFILQSDHIDDIIMIFLDDSTVIL